MLLNLYPDLPIPEPPNTYGIGTYGLGVYGLGGVQAAPAAGGGLFGYADDYIARPAPRRTLKPKRKRKVAATSAPAAVPAVVHTSVSVSAPVVDDFPVADLEAELYTLLRDVIVFCEA